MPLVPDHIIKGGATARIGRYFYAGADARYTGRQYLRGDEANVTSQLDDYIVADARVGVEFDRWEISGVVTNVFQNRYAIFGAFNINQGNPDGPTVERFLCRVRSGCSGWSCRRRWGVRLSAARESATWTKRWTKDCHPERSGRSHRHASCWRLPQPSTSFAASSRADQDRAGSVH